MEKILEVKGLKVNFKTQGGTVQAVRGVDFDLCAGETLAIVGESGSGKSVTSKAMMGLLASNGSIVGGSIRYNGKEITTMKEKEFEHLRGRDIAMIFQDPMTSLNPCMTIGHQISESMIKHQKLSRKQAREQTIELMRLVEIKDAEKRYKQYPHQFSGGMRQRIVTAAALACHPKILICDEPTTALDVTIQAQIIDLIKSLQKKLDIGIIFITHDLGVVANVADRVAVMYAGKIVEIGTADEVFYQPAHPYTWGLLASMPSMSDSKDELWSIPGSPPDLINPPKGDAFAPRNRFAMQIDFEEEPPMFRISDTHSAATWLLHEYAPKIQSPLAELRQRR
ncbi:ABC transporter ATP-binding protein [Lawsonibacter sp. LCP25S3_G6]|uniref:ABC transporter ATP-binding protein n=1 Tax=unclassified Lawsonibacter TaxID=2617946 RepID=UPI003F9D8A6B